MQTNKPVNHKASSSGAHLVLKQEEFNPGSTYGKYSSRQTENPNWFVIIMKAIMSEVNPVLQTEIGVKT